MKNNLVVNIENMDGKLVVTSRQVAKELGKEHKNVLRDLDNILSSSEVRNLIIGSSYKAKTGSYKQYLLTEEGLKIYLSTCRNITPDQYRALGIEDIDVVYSYTRFEIVFIDMLEKALNVLGIKGERQCNVDNKYRLDFYISELNIAVEYDEGQHARMKTEDSKRKEYIKSKLGCKFIRCDYRDEDVVNVMKVIKEVVKWN